MIGSSSFLTALYFFTAAFFCFYLLAGKTPAQNPVFLAACILLSAAFFLGFLGESSMPAICERFCVPGVSGAQIFLKLTVAAGAAAAFFLLPRNKDHPLLNLFVIFIFLFIFELMSHVTGSAFLRPVGYSYFLFRLYDGSRQAGMKSWKEIRPILLRVFYFPALISGPVLLDGDLRSSRASFALRRQAKRSVFLLCMGLMKVFLFLPFWRLHFETGILHPLSFSYMSVKSLLMSGFYHYMELYLDFSGLIDVVIGCSGLLGIRIPHNFRRPYLALSVSDFWRRWHITLGNFVRKHIYFPLGGSRGSLPATVRNLVICMIFIGLWHGLEWRFLFWGLMHGTALGLERLTGTWKTSRDPSIIRKSTKWFLTQIFITLGWTVFFYR